ISVAGGIVIGIITGVTHEVMVTQERGGVENVTSGAVFEPDHYCGVNWLKAAFTGGVGGFVGGIAGGLEAAGLSFIYSLNQKNKIENPYDPKNNNLSDIGSRVRTEGTRVQGRFPRNAGSNQILYRSDRSGNITHYQVYDSNGLPVMRVDITGHPHGGVPTPHVVKFERHIAPDGTIYVKPSKTVRPTLPIEIP
ncbi:MAG: hypothetical protein GY797_23315, partial [Deltaproteobacteria bacterium]|nr:hypothetical protein [Deltaproteobacteria bacterium]